MQFLALPERGDDAQQGLIQPNGISGIVSQDPVVTGKGDQAASSRAGSLQGKQDHWALGAAIAGPNSIPESQGPEECPLVCVSSHTDLTLPPLPPPAQALLAPYLGCHHISSGH